MALSHLAGVTRRERQTAVAAALWTLRGQPLAAQVDYLADDRLRLGELLSPAELSHLHDLAAIWEAWRWTWSDDKEA